MHHGTCDKHVPWCMSGSLTCGDRENVPGIHGACARAILRIWQEAHWNGALYQGPKFLRYRMPVECAQFRLQGVEWGGTDVVNMAPLVHWTGSSEVVQGLYSLSDKTSYRHISWSLEITRLDLIMIVSLWHLTGISTAQLHGLHVNISIPIWVLYTCVWPEASPASIADMRRLHGSLAIVLLSP